ncbi:MAG: glutamate racemase [Burkholderiales bacterium PBB5]|nr:MAG: glutamate racemase [Burkholderiales bacterium PBB5]
MPTVPTPTATATPPLPPPQLGVFDSGIGGLSVLAALRLQLPGARIHYIADTAYTPWGERSAHWVGQRCEQLAAHLIDAGAQLVLVACNTGTTQAIGTLRARWPTVPFVGVEPGVKPAVAGTRNGRIAVMGTSGTLRSDTLAPQLDQIAAALREAAVDTVVLGCTHYPLVAAALQQRLGDGVLLLDTADAVVRRVTSLLPPDAAVAAQHASHAAGLTLCSTADPAVLRAAARRWVDARADASALVLPPIIEAARG